jgi:hypothetical protein
MLKHELQRDAKNTRNHDSHITGFPRFTKLNSATVDPE